MYGCAYRHPEDDSLRCVAEVTRVVVVDVSGDYHYSFRPATRYDRYCDRHAPITARPLTAVDTNWPAIEATQ